MWLLWKLGKKREVSIKIVPLLEQYPDNVDLMQLGVSVYLAQGRTRQARSLIHRLKETSAPKQWLQEVEAELFVRSRQWLKAKKVYEALMVDEKAKKNLLWDYREIVRQASPGAVSGFEYFHGPESFRHRKTVQTLTRWPHPRFRGTIGIFEEIYTQRALGETASLRETVIGHRLKGEWFANDTFVLSGKWELAALNGADFHETGMTADWKQQNYHARIRYDYNRLIRSPVGGMEKHGRQDDLYLVEDILLFDRLTVGHAAKIEWFRVKSAFNTVTGKGSLGHKIINDGFMNYAVWQKPYVSLNFSYKRAHWDKAFEQADGVLDFIGDERVFSGGFYGEWKAGSRLRMTGGLRRLYDAKRNFYSTASHTSMEFWLRENVTAQLAYEFDYEANATTGSGNGQLLTVKFRWVF